MGTLFAAPPGNVRYYVHHYCAGRESVAHDKLSESVTAAERGQESEHESESRTLWQTLIARLGRVTSGRRLIPCVDGLRFIAIMAVMMHHLNGYVVGKCAGFTEQQARETWTFHLLHGGTFGVQLFFAISGFILALPFARECLPGEKQVSLKHYYFRRVTRLEPPFLINLAIVLGLLIIVRKESFAELLAPLAATMTYTHNWIYGTLSTINGVAWSLEIEVQFYILAPFLARLYFRTASRRRKAIVCGLIAAWMLMKIMNPVDGSLKLRLGLLYTFDHFMVGILIADYYVNHWKETPKQHVVWDMAFFLLLPAMFLIQLNPITYHLLPVISAFTFVAAFRGPVANRLLSIPLVVVTGGMCYSIYLYHFFVISMLGRATVPFTSGSGYLTQIFGQTCLIAPATIGVCAMFFLLIEKPFMKWRPLAE